MKTVIICAVTLDGKIARHLKDPLDWTTKEDKKIFATETKKAGVIVLGHHTFQAIGHPLKDRLNLVLTKRPGKQRSRRGTLEFTNRQPRAILKALRRRGFKTVFVIGGSQTNSLFLKAGLVNELWLTLAPKVFGWGISLFSSPVIRDLRLISLKKLSRGFLFLKYKVEL